MELFFKMEFAQSLHSLLLLVPMMVHSHFLPHLIPLGASQFLLTRVGGVDSMPFLRHFLLLVDIWQPLAELSQVSHELCQPTQNAQAKS